MTELKIIKINLKNFVEELFIAFSSNDEDSIKELDEKFQHFYVSEREDMKSSVLHYIDHSKLVSENQCLVKYFSQFSM